MSDELRFPTPQPILLVISGPSGVGKDTVAQALMETRPEQFHFVITATTRAPREGEVDGIDYFFYSEDDFAKLIEDDELLEYAYVYSDYKGIPKQQIREAMASGKDVILRVDVQGAATVRKLVPNATFVFISADSEEELIERLRARATESEKSFAMRIVTARNELSRISEFDYVILNRDGELDRAVAQLLAIVDATHSRVHQTPIEL